MKSKHVLLCLLASTLPVGCVSGQGTATAAATADGITLERIMSDPDWMGNAPQRPYWADDSQSVYFSQKRTGSRLSDLFHLRLDGTPPAVVPDEALGEVDVGGGDWSEDRHFKVYERAGDLYLKDLEGGGVRQLTRTVERESFPRFLLGDKEITFRRGGKLLARELESGLVYEPAVLLDEDDPADEDEDSDYLADQQERLFEIVRLGKERTEEAKQDARAEQAADPTRTPLPFYLGKGRAIVRTSLSPDGRRLLVVLGKSSSARGKQDAMPNYVTSSGYVESRSVRSKVGTGKPGPHELVLLDLESHERQDLDLSVLPEIARDPLADLRAARKEADAKDPGEEQEASEKEDAPEAAQDDEQEPEQEPSKPRPVSSFRIAWNENGSRVAFQVHSADNKDRWIATVDLDSGTVEPQEHLHDPGWINGRFNELGWLRDGETLWYLSEATGYSHLYLQVPGQPARAVTSGEFEVSSPRVSHDGRYVYFVSNELHPGRYEVWRFDVESGASERITDGGGKNSYALSPDGTRLLLTHSTTTRPRELVLQAAQPGAEVTQLTHTASEEFLGLPWVEPEIVAVPSSHHDRPVYSRVYDAVGPTPLVGPGNEGKRPAVIFIHGAGYLQNAHMGWSGYFREFMFHSLLAHRGYVVLDMDYRASAGYGRDWRTAIYRQMGWPEVEDLRDGVEWLVANKNVDRDRIGIYGGSYGGFLTLMALFTAPDLFAAGAALRPVTDWAHYNHSYTSNILNIPDLDPDAYAKSSPIEYAEGLEQPLLVAHGMQDDNVFFQDSLRLAQRLIELEKQDWELALYPIEPHGFREPSSWLDEYRRIFKLFRENLE